MMYKFGIKLRLLPQCAPDFFVISPLSTDVDQKDRRLRNQLPNRM